jgi:hypothetical protein
MPYLWLGWRLGLSLLSRRDGDPGDEVGSRPTPVNNNAIMMIRTALGSILR